MRDHVYRLLLSFLNLQYYILKPNSPILADRRVDFNALSLVFVKKSWDLLPQNVTIVVCFVFFFNFTIGFLRRRNEGMEEVTDSTCHTNKSGWNWETP